MSSVRCLMYYPLLCRQRKVRLPGQLLSHEFVVMLLGLINSGVPATGFQAEPGVFLLF